MSMTPAEAIKQLDGADAMLFNRNMKAFNEAIIAAITALREQEENRWIPVTEKMPKEHKSVVPEWGTLSDPVMVAFVCTTSKVPYPNNCVVYESYTRNGEFRHKTGEYKAIAWKPLPAPPKGGPEMSMNELIHYEFPKEIPKIDGTMAEYEFRIAASVAATTEKAIVQAIRKAAYENGVTDLYLMDKKFVLDALREKAEREDPKPLTIEELRQMDGEPVWLAVCNKWGLVHVDDYGQLKGRPLVRVIDHGTIFARDIERANLHCYRHKPKEEG